MEQLTIKEKANLTYRAIQRRKEAKKKGVQDAEQFRASGRLENKNKKNKRYY